MSDNANTPNPEPTAEDKATLRVKNPDTEGIAANVVPAVDNPRCASLRVLMNEAVMANPILLLMAGKDDALWTASLLGAAVDYAMGCGLTHDEIQAAVSKLWGTGLDRLREFNAIVDKAVAEGKDPKAVLDGVIEEQTASAEKAANTQMNTAMQELLIKLKAQGVGQRDKHFDVPTLPGLRGKDGKDIVH